MTSEYEYEHEYLYQINPDDPTFGKELKGTYGKKVGRKSRCTILMVGSLFSDYYFYCVKGCTIINQACEWLNDKKVIDVESIKEVHAFEVKEPINSLQELLDILREV